MWAFRNLGKITMLRSLVKKLFSMIFYNGKVTLIKFGPLKNYKWVCHEDHQWWMPLGLYEKETTNWILESLDFSDTFFDVGANAGYFTLLGSKCVGDQGEVVSFEPMPMNCETISQHINANEIENVTLESLAISNETGLVRFAIEENNPNSHLLKVELSHAKSLVRETLEVTSTTLDDFISSTGMIPNVLKVDVEGAEKMVLEGAGRLLASSKKTKWIISTHSGLLYDQCKRIMLDNGFKVESLEGFHHELICVKC